MEADTFAASSATPAAASSNNAESSSGRADPGGPLIGVRSATAAQEEGMKTPFATAVLPTFGSVLLLGSFVAGGDASAETGAEHEYVGMLVVGIGALSILGYLVMQPLMAFRFSGGRRIAALVPLLAMVPLFISTAYAFRAGSNIWPLALIIFAPFAFLYLLIIAATRWIAGRRARS
jgi:hypothetical protein